MRDRALKRMREREERKVDVVGRDLNASGNLLHVRNQIGVGQHTPFGRPVVPEV